MSHFPVLSATGVYTPEHTITNEELVASFNQYVDKFNQENKDKEPLLHSSAEFIVKASGIKKRYVVDKQGILDINWMRPFIKQRADDHPSLQCEMAVQAAKQALKRANISNHSVDFLLVSCSVLERAYPALSVEIQNALGLTGYAFDMNAACSSAAFGMQIAANAIKSGSAKTVLIVNPEICSGHVDFRNRDSHFIFGDACTAIVVQRADLCQSQHPFYIKDTRLKSLFSNNIRNNFGFLNGLDRENDSNKDKLFMQQGRKVFKEVVPWVSELVLEHLSALGMTSSQIKRLWLHQANVNMNRLIATKILNQEPNFLDAPTILEEYGNTSSPGSVIAFHHYHKDLKSGDIGLLCAFGAGYTAGNVILEKL